MTYQPDFCHIKHEDTAPALCGTRYGFAWTVKEGEDLGSPFPFKSYCKACAEKHAQTCNKIQEAAHPR